MRPRPAAAQSLPVKFLVDLSSDEDGRVSGQVALAGGSPAPFSGWLELLRLFEDHVQDSGRAPLEPDDDIERQE